MVQATRCFRIRPDPFVEGAMRGLRDPSCTAKDGDPMNSFTATTPNANCEPLPGERIDTS
ncbi:hypothetical protein XH86_02405 [Bradyrhizobium guangdongense]|uniref:Uncharacterized protein n=1 Tax=Bradyrhizobium guangdongense TaxID=1325090 RepID=A0ABX6U8R5_9BRAD|nr:hypothetical protein X265_02405 [Bradyrhizobium guangdongense]QOZ57721.1 hypothetical protein XH86_02405 [Bradyrhizobium guangdongense]